MPGTRCAVLFCKNNYYGTKKNSSTDRIKFHRFPIDETLRNKWIEFCGRPSIWYPPRGSHVCSAHFRDEDYQPKSQFYEMIRSKSNQKPKSVLKRYSVPSVLPPRKYRPTVKSRRQSKINSSSVKKKTKNISHSKFKRALNAKSEENGNVSQTDKRKDRALKLNVSKNLEEEDGFSITSTYIVEDDPLNLDLNNHTNRPTGTIEDELKNLRTMNHNLIQERKHLRASLEAEMQEKCLLMSKLKRAQEDIDFKNKILRNQQNKLTLLNKKLKLKK